MTKVDVATAADELADLLKAVNDGEEVVIMKDSHPVAKLASVKTATATPRFGSAKGEVSIAPDFDAPLEDFAPYMPPDGSSPTSEKP